MCRTAGKSAWLILVIQAISWAHGLSRSFVTKASISRKRSGLLGARHFNGAWDFQWLSTLSWRRGVHWILVVHYLFVCCCMIGWCLENMDLWVSGLKSAATESVRCDQNLEWVLLNVWNDVGWRTKFISIEFSTPYLFSCFATYERTKLVDRTTVPSERHNPSFFEIMTY